jgi:hypothetical protein
MGSGTGVSKIKAKKYFMFSPTIYWQGHLELDNFTELENWIRENGEMDNSRGILTTWEYSEIEPHEEDWIAEVLQQISPIETFENSWGQIYGPGGFHPSHNHVADDNIMSGCLYLTDGPGTMFQDPLHPSRHTCKQVKAGDYMIWSPYLYHSSPPHHSNRSILAFNLNKYDP